MIDGTRTRLIDSALSLLREQGLDAVTLRAVGELAGLSRMAPYRHFADKTALLAALAVRVIADLTAHLAAAVLQHGEHEQRLRAFYRSYVEYAVEHPEEYRLVFASQFPVGHHPELEEAIDEVMTALSPDVAGHGPRSKATMAALLATAHGLAEFATLGPLAHKGIGLDDIIDVIVKGVGRPG
ncbi:TetR/AcrR family transcriptional regulator [Nonomuraea sp. FMUSA5-5]|uniref:TetR/AcrR family transcriptional regulator n=1 Tax=Nonomuraea composti TaxID=2720023 RepID=A0ABX1BAJ5_9ACTN|nr:TetR/AcrR family transcriptional regulator [Nonomuraea sp. FMUSA5-5]NJP93872.1 TetR/AcrR family transcriptional regulator [Nonomuraea sp. FMUSA5-5]